MMSARAYVMIDLYHCKNHTILRGKTTVSDPIHSYRSLWSNAAKCPWFHWAFQWIADRAPSAENLHVVAALESQSSWPFHRIDWLGLKLLKHVVLSCLCFKKVWTQRMGCRARTNYSSRCITYLRMFGPTSQRGKLKINPYCTIHT